MSVGKSSSVYCRSVRRSRNVSRKVFQCLLSFCKEVKKCQSVSLPVSTIVL